MHRMVIGEAESYAYDELSNVSRRGSTIYTYQPAGERDQNQMRLAEYHDGSAHALSYDREGNVVSVEGRFEELVYDNLGRLREVTHASQTDKYAYDEAGLRFRREEGSEIIYTLHRGDWIVFQERYSGGVLAESRLNIVAGGQILGQVRKVGVAEPVYLYFGLDNLGSRRVVWNADGTVKMKFNYTAWGQFTRVGGSAADEWLASFTGKEYDATGLLYFNARYYDPTIGRFLTEDPSRKGHSWYSYCNNNPLTFTDPTGKKYESAASAELTGNQPASEQIGRQPTWGERARAGLHRAREKWDRFIGAWEKFNQKFAPVTWEASFVELGYGFLAAGAPVLEGIGIQQGVALVHFANTATGEYFEATYAFNLTGVQGVAATVGDIVDFGVVTGKFPASTLQSEIARSFAGDFFVGTLGLPVGPVGISGSVITSRDWKGFSLGGSLGWGAGLSVQSVNYALESMTPLTTAPMPTYMSPEEAQRLINAFQGH